MATQSVTLICGKAARIRSANPAGGSGSNEWLGVGLWSSGIYRALFQFPLPDWTGLGVRRIISAKVRLQNTGQTTVGRGASPRVVIRRITGSWGEGASEGISSSNTVTWSNQPSTVTTGEVDTGTLPTTDFQWVEEDITEIVRRWAPPSVEGGTGAPNYGIRLHSYDEGSTSRTTEFYSDDRPEVNRPRLVITYETNTPPRAPTLTAPLVASNGDPTIALISRSTGVPRVTFSGTRNDPDPGDYITAVQVQVFNDAATDAVLGTLRLDVTVPVSGSPSTFSVGVDVSTLTIGGIYRSRVKTRDKEGVWGAWSSVASMRWRPNTAPGVPANRSVDTISLTPTFYGSLVDADPGATISEARIVVYQDTTAGSILMWDSGWLASGAQRFAITYGGNGLSYGTKYRWAAQVRDNVGTAGPLSGYVAWIPREIVGPDNLSPRTVETRQTSLTPVLTVGHSQAFDSHELRVARVVDPEPLGEPYLWTHTAAYATTTSRGQTYAGTPLTWGRVYYWQARVRVAGVTWSPWSPWYPFYVNALPYAPAVSIVGAGIATPGPYGTYVAVVGLQPQIEAPFADPDLERGYVDVPQRKEIEIRRADTLAVHGTYAPAIVSGTASGHVINPALLVNVTYQVRVRWRDSAGRDGPWSEWLLFKPTVAPSVALGTAHAPTDPTPTLDWTVSDKTQASYQVTVTDVSTDAVVWDSGTVDTPDTYAVVPGRTLENGRTYRWSVLVTDTDGLTATVTGSNWTTTFAVPPALEGLVAEADPGASMVRLDWTATTLDAEHFWRYLVFRRIAGSGRYDYIGYSETTSYVDVEAPHGVVLEYAVNVSDGWSEGVSGEASVLLELGWWIVHPSDPGLTFEFRYVPSGGLTERWDQQQTTYQPIGRDAPIVVSAGLLPPSGTLSARILSEDRAIFDLLLRAATVEPYVLLKSPFGDVHRARLGTVERGVEQAGVRPVTVSYTAVA